MNNYYVYIYLDPRKPGQYCYEDVCFIFEPIYVGKGKNRRWKEINGNGRTIFFKNKINSIKKSGLKPIVIKLFENLNEKESLNRETELINKIKEVNSKILINFTDGGDGTSGYKFSKEIREIIAKKQRKNFKIIKNEFERRKYILLTEEEDYKNNKETKLKYICQKGHEGSIRWNDFQKEHGCPICYNELRNKNIGMKNKKHSEKTKRKMSENNKGKNNPNFKLTNIILTNIWIDIKKGDLTNKEIIKKYGVCRYTIWKIKTGKIKLSQ